MCSRCNQPIFSKKWDARIGPIVYWATFPVWGTFWLILAIVTLPMMLVACGVTWAARRGDEKDLQDAQHYGVNP